MGSINGEAQLSELHYYCEDKDGSVALDKKGQIVTVCLAGACGTKVIDFYIETLQMLGRTYAGKPWAYFCNSRKFEATTPEAHENIIDNYRTCMELGCKYDAYCYESPVAIAQTQAIMRACGNDTPIEDVLFDEEHLAIEFLMQKLASIKSTQRN